MIRSILASIALSVLCLFCSGCATVNQGNNPQSDLYSEDSSEPKRENFKDFFKAKFGESSGVDPRAREIERRLGY